MLNKFRVGIAVSAPLKFVAGLAGSPAVAVGADDAGVSGAGVAIWPAVGVPEESSSDGTAVGAPDDWASASEIWAENATPTSSKIPSVDDNASGPLPGAAMLTRETASDR